METLKFLLESKKADPETPRDVVREAVEWVQIQLQNAKIVYGYTEGGTGLGTYGHIEIRSQLKEQSITLHLKVAEINGSAFAFAEVGVSGHRETILFPFFGEISTADGKLMILHYIADFILSTTPEAVTD